MDKQRLWQAACRGAAAAGLWGLVSAAITRVQMRAVTLVTEGPAQFTWAGTMLIAVVYVATLFPGAVALAYSAGRWPLAVDSLRRRSRLPRVPGCPHGSRGDRPHPRPDSLAVGSPGHTPHSDGVRVCDAGGARPPSGTGPRADPRRRTGPGSVTGSRRWWPVTMRTRLWRRTVWRWPTLKPPTRSARSEDDAERDSAGSR